MQTTPTSRLRKAIQLYTLSKPTILLARTSLLSFLILKLSSIICTALNSLYIYYVYIELFQDTHELVFVAGNNTVYFKKLGQSSWTLFSASLPARTTIQDFSVYDDGTNQSALRVSQYGRGMWEVPMTTLRSIKSEFVASNQYPCVGASVQFNDQSTGNVTSWIWSFQGGTPSTSNLQNPIITYNTAGIYDVTLTTSDGTNSNTQTKISYINTNGAGLPISEGFESATFPPPGFSIIDAGGDAIAWQQNSSAGGFGSSANSVFFNNYSFDVAGKKDELRTTPFDISGFSTSTLSFDVAYQPYNNTNYSDTLEILVSTNCGASFTSVYKRGGTDLSTAAGTNTSPFVPTAAQWRKETIDLSSFIASGSVLLSFKNLGYYGNNLYFDNINLNATFSTNAGPDRSICYGVNTTIGSTSVAGVSYSWNPTIGLSSSTNSNPTASPPSNTTYVLTATKNGSSVIDIDTVIVIVDSVPINSQVTKVSCFGGNNGAIDLTFSAGNAPYNYLWNNGATSEDRTNLLQGTYTVTITDALGCSRAYTFIITQPSAALNASTTTVQSQCNQNNGSALAIPVGGTAPYTYQWNNGVTTALNNNVTAGNYSVTVTDNKNCTTTAIASITMKPLPVINSFTTSAFPVCIGTPFTLTVNASGGSITNSFSSGTINLAIPDNTPAGINNTIAIGSGINLNAASKLSITLNFGTGTVAPNREHTYIGDLKITLSTPGGNTIVFDRPGAPVSGSGNSADFNGSYTFTTSAATILPQLSTDVAVVAGNVVNGNYKPSDSSNPDAAHNWAGITMPFNVTGNWILSITDNAASDVGDLISWSINFATPFTHVISGAGTIGSVNCLNSDCSNANSIVSNAPAGVNQYIVTTTSPDGCTVSANRLVIVTALPNQPSTITGPTQVCENDTVNYSISAVSGSTSYSWIFPSGWIIKSGQGTTSTRVDPSVTNGNVSVTANNSCGSSLARTISTSTGFCTLNLTVKAFIEGFYTNDTTMTPVLFTNGLNASALSSDSVTIELHDQFTPSNTMFSAKKIIDVHGTIQVTLPYTFNGGSYFIVVRHRNSIVTWSKLPVTLGYTTNFDFRY